MPRIKGVSSHKGSSQVHIGTRIGKREIIGVSDKKSNNNGTMYVTRCDCGKEEHVQPGNFLRHTTRPSCMDCARLEEGEACIRDILRNYRDKKRHPVFELSYEEFKALITDNCHYCGRPPSNLKRKAVMGEFRYNGIDRKDNSVGYVMGNVVTCCKDDNLSKRNKSYEEYLDHIKRVHEHCLLHDRIPKTNNCAGLSTQELRSSKYPDNVLDLDRDKG